LKGHTENRAGTVKLRSANPTDWPEVNFRYFDEGDTGNGESAADLESVVNAVEFVRGIIEKSDDLLLFSGSKEIWPGGGAESRAEIGTWIKNEAWGHHASCSAAIGADGDDMAVLDSKFRVRGVSGLRVVDASVFPRIPGTFIVLPTYMMSEKAADTILEDVR
jgi:choline dehydrogenase